jgi:hypothetical protein
LARRITIFAARGFCIAKLSLICVVNAVADVPRITAAAALAVAAAYDHHRSSQHEWE